MSLATPAFTSVKLEMKTKNKSLVSLVESHLCLRVPYQSIFFVRHCASAAHAASCHILLVCVTETSKAEWTSEVSAVVAQWMFSWV